MAPPNSVALAAPIPTDYFSEAYGKLASLPTMHTWHGFAQPIVPVAHYDVNSTALAGPTDGTVMPNPIPGIIGPPTHVPGPGPGVALPPWWQNIGSIVNRGDFTNPLSWWRRQIETRRFGHFLPDLPGIPERGA